MRRRYILLLTSALFSSIISSFLYIYIKYLNFPEYFYSVLIAIPSLAAIFSAITYGHLKYTKENYFNYVLFGIFGTLLSTYIYVFYKDPFIYIINTFLFNFSATVAYYAIIKYTKDVKMNFYNAIFTLIGYLIVYLLVLIYTNLDFLFILFFIAHFIGFLVVTILVAKNLILNIIETLKKEIGILNIVDTILASVEEKVNKELERYVPDIRLNEIKIERISLINFIAVIGFSSIYTKVVYLVNTYNLTNMFPIFFLISSGIGALAFLIPPKENIKLSSLGMLIRIFVGILILLVLFNIINIQSYSLAFFILLFILIPLSWNLFVLYADNFILKVREELFSSVYFFRNLAGFITPFIVPLLPGISPIVLGIISLIISIVLIFKVK